MRYPKRTAYCEKCGSVGFKIRQIVGKSEYVCAECFTFLALRENENYKRLDSICKRCNSDVFKIKIEESDKKECWKVKCINCKEEPSIIYIDDEGLEIDRVVRELLLIKKSILNLQNDISKIESDMNESECNIRIIKNSMENSNAKDIEYKDDIHRKIEAINYIVDKQKIKTINMDDEINKLRNRLNNIASY